MPKTILLVDDFENTLFFTATTLEKKGFNVIKATSGQEALRHCNGQEIDLVITDFNMPQMNGLELVEQIKQDERYTRVPIFMLTTEIKPEIKEKAMKVGVTSWVKKPFDLIQLLKLVEKILA
jgi:two-component system, chemotaxis family, chemotaxis protein CheY